MLSHYHVLKAGPQYYPKHSPGMILKGRVMSQNEAVCVRVGLLWLSWTSLESMSEQFEIQVLSRIIRHTPHVFKISSSSKEFAHDHTTQSQHRVWKKAFCGNRQCIHGPNSRASRSKNIQIVTSVKKAKEQNRHMNIGHRCKKF